MLTYTSEALEADLTSQGYGVITLAGPDRTPSGDDMKIGMLETITYPTGGTTTFTYEPHDFGYVRDQVIPAWAYGCWNDELISLISGMSVNFTIEAHDQGTRPVDIHTHLKIIGRPPTGSTISCGDDEFDLCVQIKDGAGILVFQQTESPNDDDGGCVVGSSLSNPSQLGDRDEDLTFTCDLPEGTYTLSGAVSQACLDAEECGLDADVT